MGRPLRACFAPPLGADESGTCAFERAADPLDSPQIDPKPLGNLTHAFCTPRPVQSLTVRGLFVHPPSPLCVKQEGLLARSVSACLARLWPLSMRTGLHVDSASWAGDDPTSDIGRQICCDAQPVSLPNVIASGRRVSAGRKTPMSCRCGYFRQRRSAGLASRSPTGHTFIVNSSRRAASRFSQRIPRSEAPSPFPRGLRSGNGSRPRCAHLQSLP